MAEADAVRSVRSYCRICTCQCGLVIDLIGDTVIKVRGDKDNPASRGYTCPKGRAVADLYAHPDGIDRPFVRHDGALVATSWDECLDDLAARLKRVIDDHGPEAVGVFFGSGLGMDAAGFKMAEAFFAQLGSPAKFSPMTIDGTAKTLVASLVGGFPGLSPRTDYAKATTVLFVGVNPLISHGHNIAMVNPALILKDVARRGQVWMIDPRVNESSPFVTRHLAPKPGADYAILGYLVRELMARGEDQAAQPIAGRDELAAGLAPFTLARAAEIAGLPEQDLLDLYEAVRSGPVSVETGTGVTMTATANVTQWLSWVLMILTGAMNRPGGMWFHPGFNVRFDTMGVPIYDNPWTPGPPTRPELTGLIGDWPCAALPDEIFAGNIKALVNFGGSLVRSFPDANILRKALAELDVLATFEIMENETTALSTHVLPTKSQLERPEIPLWDTLSSRLSAQYAPAVVPPRGERRAAWWIIAGLMERLGMTVPAGTPANDLAEGADEAMLAALIPHARRSFAEIRSKGYVEEELELPARWVDAHIERFGGWRLAPPALLSQLGKILADEASRQLPPGGFAMIPRRMRRHLNAALLFLGDTCDVLINPEDAAPLGIADRQAITVATDRGRIQAVAKLDPGMRRGVVSVPHGFPEANVNELTSKDAVDRISGMVLYSGFPVEIATAP
ncbi:MAG: molybdopterin-dependent oxidoreductase [Novosphingobium sp.]|nr:molybdopterin-dependent oxidoreductase [Novosphingobium sp.]